MDAQRKQLLAMVAVALSSVTACVTPRAAPAVPADAGTAQVPWEDFTPLAAEALNEALVPEQRAVALQTLAAKTGISALSVAVVCLGDANRELRLTAASVSGALGGKDAKAALIARRGVEEDAEVRDALQLGVAKSEP